MKKIYLAIAGVLMLGANSCIEETLPTDYVLGPQIEASNDALKGMVGAVYTTLACYKNGDGGIERIGYGGMRVMLEHGTTGLICTGNNGFNTMAAYCTGSVSANSSNRGIYPSYLYYAYIKSVNDVIGMISSDTDDPVRRAYLGICYAYRALFYHDLVQIMEYKTPTPKPGITYVEPERDIINLGVPIVTEETPADKLSDNPRATVDEVYDLILADLKSAETYLANYTRADKIEADLSVVYGLYARVYCSLASRVATSKTYKDEDEYWKNAIKYADKAKQAGGYSPLTEEQWTDPVNGFNNRNSQNSWMLATTLSESNSDAMRDSFNFAMIMDTESTFSSYGWRVGRSLNRKMYEQLSNTDFRKMSWIDPSFFYESINQVEGQPYLVEKDADNVIINNKWKTNSGWSDEYSGFGPQKKQYRLNVPVSWLRERISVGNGFVGLPWLYVNLKFRPHNGAYSDYYEGGAIDFPIMRVEEMDFIKAEAQFHTSGAATAKATLETLIKTRDANYPATAVYPNDFMKELNFQKQIEFWGEGINYFDAKRQELGLHRRYVGINANRGNHCIDVDGVFCGWTPGWNQAERNANPILQLYNNPFTNTTQFTEGYTNAMVAADFGKPIQF